MNKVRWMKIESPIAIRTLCEKMLERQFSMDKNQGFILSKCSDNHCSGRYINKIVSTDKIEDPYGNVSEYERVRFNSINFSITDSPIVNFELLNYPRLIKPLFNALNEITDFNLTVDSGVVDLSLWLRKIREAHSDIKVNKLDFSGINIGDKAIAKMSIKSSQDIKDSDVDFIPSKEYSIDNVECSFIRDSKQIVFSLSKFKSAKFNDDDSYLLLPLLRSCLESSMSR